MHLGRAALEEHPDDLARRRPAHDRVVHDHDPLAGHLAERVELRLDPVLAQRLVGLDERPADVAVLDQPLRERDPARAGEADRRRRARVGDRHHDVRLDRRLRRESLAHPHARSVQLDPAHRRVGPREVDELEDAERAGRHVLDAPGGPARPPRRRRRARPARSRARARRRAGRARTSRTRARDPRRAGPSTSGRIPFGSRNPISFPSERSTAENAPWMRRIVSATASSSGRSSFAISAAITSVSEVDASRTPRATQLVAELGRVREVAVVAERDRPRRPVVDDRLRVAPARRARRRVAAVRDRRVALEAAQLVLAEDLRDEAHVPEGGQPLAVRDRDPGRLLAAVLEREEPEVREPGDVALGRPDAEDAAHG